MGVCRRRHQVYLGDSNVFVPFQGCLKGIVRQREFHQERLQSVRASAWMLYLKILAELGWSGNEPEVLAAGVLFHERSKLRDRQRICLRQRELLDCLWKEGFCTLKGRDKRSSNIQLEPPEDWCASRLSLASMSLKLGGSECALLSPDWMRLSIIPGVVQWNGKQGCSWADFLLSRDSGDWGMTLAVNLTVSGTDPGEASRRKEWLEERLQMAENLANEH